MSTSERELVFPRFVHFLVVRWWLPTVFAVVLIALVGLVLGSTNYRQTTVFKVPESNVRLVAAGLPENALAEQLPLSEDIAVVNSPGVRSEVESLVGATVSPNFATSDVSSTLVVKGSDSAAVKAASSEYAKRVLAARQERFGALLDPLAQDLSNSASVLQTQINDLDAVLVGAPSDSPAVALALAVARQRATTDLATVKRQMAEVDAARADPSQVLVVVEGSPSQSSFSRAAAALGAGVAGAGLGVAALYLLAFLDRRARSRADVEVCAGAPAVSLLPRPDDAVAVRRAAAVVSALAQRSESGVLRLVQCENGDAQPIDGLIGALREVDPEIDAQGLPALDEDQQVLADPGAVVVVARFARTDRDRLRQTVDDLRAVGADVLGVLLVDVPARQMRWAGRPNV